ncbi:MULTISPECIES: siderophore-interacting protein [Streptomyces]|jgi:NADPH-dependent ferric siderophore reductase|uniref:Siderophore-interacting protein n=1 Tax=Streptomyces doudnae TaxID=3075536 RepID=A0ABD5F1F1_9ACTN|nr:MULTISPECIES: siderophore-interacting protein [unclassified Streptomyces]MDT0440313.1 siderophore-interacting protein [Streptomyces sp. DSM 41981]MYQ62741.1 SIP domain-containing protein [Streptomyces sp. SID4950]SCD43505.1 NADPH-dependent ferric siderophore reductase, contains FAD-binding and SIP domains [Streptomyces sp. SolWspMP-5a-2]
MAQGRGWEGTVLRLMRAKDFTLTVTGVEDVTPEYRRLRLDDGGLLAATGVHPTMWVRLWFDNAGRPHQRAYTLVDPDPATGTFSFEFALHEGAASDWARAAAPGDTIEATVQGTGFEPPEPAPGRVLAIGDPASLPAINSLLGAFATAPATVWFEGGGEGLPFRAGPGRHEVRRVARGDLVARVRAELPEALAADPAPYVWIACDTRTTRTLSAYVRKELGVARERTHALGYWRAG